ncbi:MAG: peptidase M15, partial [Psychroserpens sp.]|nr:peptidase M15 [Psychroserpens sp.]
IIDGITNVPLDMGSPYDFFGRESWIEYPELTDDQRANRQLLQEVMLKHNFRNYSKEWWHFTLRAEPFPDTYFDFEIQNGH